MVASYDKTKLYTIGNNDPDYSNEIYQLSCGDKSMTDCEWTEMATKLQDGRYYHVAFLISNDLTQKICNWAWACQWQQEREEDFVQGPLLSSLFKEYFVIPEKNSVTKKSVRIDVWMLRI